MQAFELREFEKTYGFSLIDFEPVISQRTMDFHYNKHLAGYINKLNELIKGTEFADMPLIEIVKRSDGDIFNNAAQAWNHDFYFEQFIPVGDNWNENSEIINAIFRRYGTVGEFKRIFNNAAFKLFGSGWMWLCANKGSGNTQLELIPTENAGNPLQSDVLVPLLVFDMWEHAYYLDYQNSKDKYIHNLWNIINWEIIEERFNNIKL